MNENTLKSGTTLRGNYYTYNIQKVLEQDAFSITYLALNRKDRSEVALTEFFMRDINERSGDAVITDENDKELYNKYAINLAQKLHESTSCILSSPLPLLQTILKRTIPFTM